MKLVPGQVAEAISSVSTCVRALVCWSFRNKRVFDSDLLGDMNA